MSNIRSAQSIQDAWWWRSEPLAEGAADALTASASAPEAPHVAAAGSPARTDLKPMWWWEPIHPADRGARIQHHEQLVISPIAWGKFGGVCSRRVLNQQKLPPLCGVSVTLLRETRAGGPSTTARLLRDWQAAGPDHRIRFIRAANPEHVFDVITQAID